MSDNNTIFLALFFIIIGNVQAFLTTHRTLSKIIPTYLPIRASRVVTAAAISVTATPVKALEEFDYNIESKLPWSPDGYKFWDFKGYKINYLDMGTEALTDKPPLLLIHGFGASIYHWRYNIPILARDYHVYAVDLLGFGLSEKPIIEYTVQLWAEQVLNFIEDIIGTNGRQSGAPCVVVGNSLGGLTALHASAIASKRGEKKKLIGGCVLLNSAGRYRSSAPANQDDALPQPAWQQWLTATVQRFIIALSFYYTKQPARIEQVLRQVYPVDDRNVDAELVESIRVPAQDPNAPEVFYRIISKNGNGGDTFVEDLLVQLNVPLLLLWGEKDPWIRPQAADLIQSLFPAALRVNVDAGHCPHDEAPDAVNREIAAFVAGLSR